MYGWSFLFSCLCAPLVDNETYFVPFMLTLICLYSFRFSFFLQEFNDFVVRCLEKKPAERPTSRALLRVSCLLVLVSDAIRSDHAT